MMIAGIAQLDIDPAAMAAPRDGAAPFHDAAERQQAAPFLDSLHHAAHGHAKPAGPLAEPDPELDAAALEQAIEQLSEIIADFAHAHDAADLLADALDAHPDELAEALAEHLLGMPDADLLAERVQSLLAILHDGLDLTDDELTAIQQSLSHAVLEVVAEQADTSAKLNPSKQGDKSEAPGASKSLGAALKGLLNAAGNANPAAELTQLVTGHQNAAKHNAQQNLAQQFAAPSSMNAVAQGESLSEQNTARLARALNAAVNQNGGSLLFRMTPPDLGTVRVQLQVQAGTVTAQIHTQNETARSLLASQLSHLRAGLEAQGLTVERLSVQTMNSQPSASSQMNAQHNDTPNEGRSRGQYTAQENDRHDDNDHDERDDASFDQLLNAHA